jgi:selenocysteine lyase/cysteine desulfurase
MPAPALDLDYVRTQIPAFSAPEAANWTHFENAGGSFPAKQTIDLLSTLYRTKVQPYGVGLSGSLGQAMDSARARWAEALGVTGSEVVFGPSTSANTYTLSHAFRPLLTAGDEIIVTDQDHEANSGVWRRMAEEIGMTLREWKVSPETGRLDPADFHALLSDKTKLVTFTHCSNLAGEENPVADLTAAARAAGAWSVVDGVSWAPHEICDVNDLGADVYMFSLYKVYGVHQGLMTVRTPLMERLGNQSHYFNAGSPAAKLNPAGPDHAQVAATAGTLDYIQALAAHHGVEANDLHGQVRAVSALWRKQEQAVTAPLLAFLSGHSRVRLIGSDVADARRAPTVAFMPSKISPPDLEKALGERGFITGANDFYARRLVEALGLDPDIGVMRISMTHYTSEQDVARVIEALDALL